jgi:hypothetical protein
MWIVLVKEGHVHVSRSVRLDRHGVFREVCVSDASVAGIDDRMLHQRHADAADHAADALAAAGLRIDDAPCTIGADDASHPGLGKVGIDRHFNEHATEGMHGEPFAGVARF